MPTPSLIRVRCLDAERAVGLVNYADMVVYDQEKNVVAVRIGGYPETVQAMSDAILGGCELELTGSKSSLCLNSQGRRNYARRISHDGVYAEGIHWLQDDSLQSLAVGQDDDDPKSEKETVSLKRNLYIFCTSSDELFDELDAPVERVCGLNIVSPFSPVLEDKNFPHPDDIYNAVKRVLNK